MKYLVIFSLVLASPKKTHKHLEIIKINNKALETI